MIETAEAILEVSPPIDDGRVRVHQIDAIVHLAARPRVPVAGHIAQALPDRITANIATAPTAAHATTVIADDDVQTVAAAARIVDDGTMTSLMKPS